MDRVWYWAMPGLALIVAAFTLTGIGFLMFTNELPDGWGLQAVITFVFFFPGLLLSLGVSQIILSKRGPREVSTAERVLIGILVILTVILALTSLDENAYIGIVIGPIIMIVAIALTITIAVNSTRAREPVVVPAVWTQPAPPEVKPDAEGPSSPYGPAS